MTIAKPLPCPVCHRRPTVDDTRFYGDPMVSCCGSFTHSIVFYGATVTTAIRRWNRLAAAGETR